MKASLRMVLIGMVAVSLGSRLCAAPQSGSIILVGRSDVDPTVNRNELFDVSADGSIAMGFGYVGVVGAVNRGYQPFLWRATTGVENIDLPDSYGGVLNDYGVDRSRLNRTGTAFCAVNNTAGGVAFIWRQNQPLQKLGSGMGPSYAIAISDDTLKVAGWVGGNPARAAFWSPPQPGSDGWTIFGANYDSRAYGMTPDGAQIVGSLVQTPPMSQNPQSYAFLWTAGGGFQLFAPNGLDYSEAYAISADGSTITGLADNGTHSSTPYRWTSGSGLQYLQISPSLPAGTLLHPYAINTNGSVIAGTSNSRALIWDSVHQVCDLEEVLAAGGVNMDDIYLLYDVGGVSANGTVVVGNGQDSHGAEKGFVATLPKAWTDGKPLINLRQMNGGQRVIHYVGVLQQSADLVSWQDMSPQPTSPYQFTPSGNRMFFRARLPTGGGLLMPMFKTLPKPTPQADLRIQRH
jgi:uncharacterized membrane protein